MSEPTDREFRDCPNNPDSGGFVYRAPHIDHPVDHCPRCGNPLDPEGYHID